MVDYEVCAEFGTRGKIRSTWSLLWAKACANRYPSVNPQIQSPGSANAPTALIAGTAELGPMSRAMKAEEEDKFEQKFGYKPTRISVALDCVAVYLNKDNPIHGLTLDQLDCIFSKTRKSGFADVSTWGQVGLTGDWERLPISLYGRNSESGTYAYFKEHVFKKGDYKDTVKEQPGSAAVVNGVAKDRAGIGYSGIGYKTSEVRTVKLTAKLTAPLAEPSYENALVGNTRFPGPFTSTSTESPTRRCRRWWLNSSNSYFPRKGRRLSSRKVICR